MPAGEYPMKGSPMGHEEIVRVFYDAAGWPAKSS